MIWKELSGRQKEKEEFSALAELVEAPEANPPVTSETPPAEADEPDEAAELRDLAPLFAQNGDCIGWLSIPGTQINYPVMHTPEEPQNTCAAAFTANTVRAAYHFWTGGAVLTAITSSSTATT